MKKKLVSIVITLVLVLGITVPAFAAPAVPFKLYSDAALVCDMTTGEVLYSTNATDKRYPASTTKMLTGILALEHLNLDDTTTVSSYAASFGGNTLNLKAGEKFVLRDLLYGTMVYSANDGATAIAEAVSGSVEEFAKLMNKKAAEIGCTGSNFVNPHGLHDDNHYTTAYDLALIAMYCMQNETFRDIVSHVSYTVPATNMSKERTVENTNWLLNDTVDSHRVYAGNEYRYCKYDGAIGIKTGQTNKAGSCLVSAATRKGTTILAVCLHAGNTFERFADAIQLLDLGFAEFKTVQTMSKGADLGTIKVKKGSVKTVDVELSSDIFATLKTSESNSIVTTQIELEEQVKAPVTKGQKLGTVSVYKGGELLDTYDALAKADVPEGGFLSNFGIEDATAAKIFKVIKTIITIIIILIVLFIAWVIYEKQRIKKKKARKAARAKARAERENLNKSDIYRQE